MNRILEFRREPHLSATGISSYVECGLAYRFSRIDKLKPEFIPDSMSFGSTIHETLAGFHQERMIGKILTADELKERFEHHWTNRAWENEEIRYKPGNSFEILLAEGERLIETYHDNFNDHDLTVLAIEEPFKVTIEGLPVAIVGVLDLVEEDQHGSIIINDFKTSAKSYTEDDVSRNFQLTLYHLALKTGEYSERNIILRIDCLVKTKTPQFKRYYTIRNKTDQLKAVKKISEVWKGISKGIFIPHDGWKCKDCMYHNACEDWYSRAQSNQQYVEIGGFHQTI